MTHEKGLTRITEGHARISLAEREARIVKARRLMLEQGLAGILLEPGPNLFYFTGIRWEISERPMVALIPATGRLGLVCARFEEPRLREKILFDEEVRVWEEHESPTSVLAGLLGDRGIGPRPVGVEASIRYFVFDGIRRHSPRTNWTSADSITVPCRRTKSAAEIALLQLAADVTIAALETCASLLYEGMSEEEAMANSIKAHKALGADGGAMVQFGKATAFPHGSEQPSCLKESDTALMDGGCTIDGYHSDITRTMVFGEPTKRQREIWFLERAAQAAAFGAASIGAPIEKLDAAAREVIVAAGLGPGYEVPGLPHRTGHGIGLEEHEHPYVVRGNQLPLAPGMCFSNEPMIVLPGEFGVRLEDCIYMTAEGPRYFTPPSVSLDSPFS